jgi:uncharacterized membrane protein
LIFAIIRQITISAETLRRGVLAIGIRGAVRTNGTIATILPQTIIATLFMNVIIIAAFPDCVNVTIHGDGKVIVILLRAKSGRAGDYNFPLFL